MTRYSIESGICKYIEGYGVLSFARNISSKWKIIIGCSYKNRLDFVNTASK